MSYRAGAQSAAAPLAKGGAPSPRRAVRPRGHADLGGATLDLGGGVYAVSRTLLVPQGYANYKVQDGTFIAGRVRAPHANRLRCRRHVLLGQPWTGSTDWADSPRESYAPPDTVTPPLRGRSPSFPADKSSFLLQLSQNCSGATSGPRPPRAPSPRWASLPLRPGSTCSSSKPFQELARRGSRAGGQY